MWRNIYNVFERKLKMITAKKKSWRELKMEGMNSISSHKGESTI